MTNKTADRPNIEDLRGDAAEALADVYAILMRAAAQSLPARDAEKPARPAGNETAGDGGARNGGGGG